MSKLPTDLHPLDEDCDGCSASAGETCKHMVEDKRWHGICDERWRRAAETRECLEEDRLERQRDVLADMRVRLGGPV